MDKLIGQWITTAAGREGTIVAAAHEGGTTWQLLIITDDGHLTGVPAGDAQLERPTPRR